MTYDDLPVDPDVDSGGGRASRPLHLRAPYAGLVFIGGALGTAAREGLSLAWPDSGFPATIFAVNVTGAFALGLLLELLVRHGPDAGRRRVARLLLGTGFLGGYTTYSTFAVGATQLMRHADAGTGWLYAIATVLVGAIATTAGIVTGAMVHRRTAP